MSETDAYATARGVESAIKEAARKAAAADASLTVGKRIQLEYFNRFLCRVFSAGEQSEWVLKGGTGILARVASTRSTVDIDLYRTGFTLEEALSDLQRLAAKDLGDHFRFQYSKHSQSIGTDAQLYTDGYRVEFDVYIGANRRGSIQIDLAVGVGMTAEPSLASPVTALELPRLASRPYRLYPVVDQIADKVCATMTDYQGKRSSREKDLVDLVVFATTQTINGTDLSRAIATEVSRRKMATFERFDVPASWGRGYAKLSKPVPYCSDYPTVELARELAVRLIDPALMGEAGGRIWSPTALRWE